MAQAETRSDPQISVRLRGSLVLQTLSILLIPLVTLFITLSVLISTSLGIFPDADGGPLLPIVVVAIVASALVILVRLGQPSIGGVALIGIWTAATSIGMLTVGVTQYAPALLILPICAAGLLFDRKAAISLAIIAAILIGSIGWLETRGQLIADQKPPILLDLLTQQRIPIAMAFWIGLFIAVAALTSLLAGGMHRALAESHSQAEQLRRLSATLEARVAAQTNAMLAQERQAAMLEERTRLAREIHDTIAQSLTGVIVQLGAARHISSVAPHEIGAHIDLASEMARTALTEARRSVWDLRSQALAHNSLADALRSLAERAQPGGGRGQFRQHGQPWPLRAEAEAALLRVAQEAQANITKHAHASQSIVTLTYTDDLVVLTVQDNGSGFDEITLRGLGTPMPSGGFGLIGMRERLALLGGWLNLTNDDGAVVMASLPRDRHEHAAAAPDHFDLEGLTPAARRELEGAE